MASKETINGYIKELQLSNKTRGDCPVCFRKNTFSFTKVGLDILYYCFSVHCNLKGRITDALDLSAARSLGNELFRNCEYGYAYNSTTQRSVPITNQALYTTFVPASNNSACINFLDQFNVSQFVSQLKYDPIQNRLVFPLTDHQEVNHGYVGRALVTGVLPRWLVYLRTMGCPYICNTHNECSVILVEDCISAIRGMGITNCISLLGTSLGTDVIPYLLKYEHIYIALDPDALAKSIKLQQQLSYYRPTEILSLTKDLKYYDNPELEQLKKQIKE